MVISQPLKSLVLNYAADRVETTGGNYIDVLAYIPIICLQYMSSSRVVYVSILTQVVLLFTLPKIVV